MLFDHQNDPFELNNLADDSDHAAIMVRLKKKIQASPIAAKR